MATTMGVGMLSESLGSALETAQTQAREVSSRVQSDVISSAAKVRQQASEVASMDISKIELSGSIDKLRESARESASSLSSNAAALGSRMGSLPGSWVSAESTPLGAPGADGASDGGRPEDGSDSGAEEAAWGVSSVLGGSVAARLGLGAVRGSEKESLMPKADVESGGGGGGGSSSSSSAFARFELPSWQPGLGKLNELGDSMRNGLGMEKPKGVVCEGSHPALPRLSPMPSGSVDTPPPCVGRVLQILP